MWRDGEPMIFVGIDNGLDGAMVYLNGKQVVYFDTPTVEIPSKRGSKKRTYFIPEMVNIATAFRGATSGWENEIMFFLEDAHSMPASMSGGVANFSKGYGFGLWQGILTALGLPYQLVPAVRWQKEMLRDVSGTDTKTRSLLKASRLFPTLPLMSSPRAKQPNMDGRSDAALIAEWGRLTVKG
jgi:hypothetical protein